MGTGVNASKDLSYSVLTPPSGVSVAKDNTFVVLTPPTGVSVSKDVTYVVLAGVSTPIWPNFTFNNGTVGIAYAQQFDLDRSSGPTTYSITAGSLPPGLSLNNVSGGDGNLGSITGTPTTVGTYSFTIRATNSFGAIPKGFSITIYAAALTSSFTFAM